MRGRPRWGGRTRTTSTTSPSSPTAQTSSSTRCASRSCGRLPSGAGLMPQPHSLPHAVSSGAVCATCDSGRVAWSQEDQPGWGLVLEQTKPCFAPPPSLHPPNPSPPPPCVRGAGSAGRRGVRGRGGRSRGGHRPLQARQGLHRGRLRQGRRGRRGAGGRPEAARGPPASAGICSQAACPCPRQPQAVPLF
jgi:hypothetical protein